MQLLEMPDLLDIWSQRVLLMPIVDQCVYLLIVENAEDLLILLITLATKIEVIMPESTRSFVFAPEITKLSPLLLEDCVSVYIHQLI